MMFGVDDALDDAHWVNVQDPIKQMFLAITKAIRSQSAGIRDLDRKCSEFVTNERANNLIQQSADKCCSKQDATQIIYKIDTKASDKDLAVVDSKLDQAFGMIEKINDTLHSQTIAISDINYRLDRFDRDIQALQNPNYDQIFSYIDRQIANTVGDFERKIDVKADIKYVDTALPQRLEDLYRTMNVKINDMKVDIAKSATKEEFHALANQKADSNELRSIASELSERTTRHELHQSINNHVKPLVTAMSALEAALSVQENMSRQHLQNFQDKASALERMHHEQQEYRLKHAVNASGQAPASVDRVQQMIDDAVRDRRLGEVSQLHLDMSIAQTTEYLMKQMGIVGESIRLEIITANREELGVTAQQLHKLKDFVTETTNSVVEKNRKTSQQLKVLSTNVADSLSKKLAIRDYKRLSKDQQLDILSQVGGGVSSGKNSKSLINESRNLTHSGADSASEANNEFDYLLQTLNQESDYVSDEDHHHEGDAEHKERSSSAARRAQSAASTPYRQTPGVAAAVARRSALKTPRSASAGRARVSTTPHTNTPGASNISPSKRFGESARVSSGGASVEALRLTVDALVKQNERLEERLAVHQRELATVRDHQRAAMGGGVGATPGRMSAPGSPQRMLNGSFASTMGGYNGNTSQHASHLASATTAELERLDWRLALGEVSMNLRREVADKASREELYSAVRTEMSTLEQQLAHIQKAVDGAASAEGITKVDNELSALKHQVAGELIGARFLWTRGNLVEEGWVPWDVQAKNAAPNAIIWQKSCTKLQIRVAGLYRVCVSMFTTVPAIVQVYLNDEPLFSYQPENLDNQQALAGNANGLGAASNSTQKLDRYFLKRLRHSAGEVTCLSIDEYVSLPKECTLSVRYHSAVPAQGFFSIKKM